MVFKLKVGAAVDGSSPDAATGFKAGSAVSAPVAVEEGIEQCGHSFIEWIIAKNKPAQDEGAADENDGGDDDEVEMDLVMIEDEYIAGCEAADWKKQDHYKLMGLQKYRYKATQAMIQASYKKQVLWHHPDRKSSNKWSEEERSQADTYFTCVKKAFEILNDETNRRLYDSVDNFEEAIPTAKVKPEKFYTEFGKCFERNAKWFWPDVAPTLGDANTSKDVVDDFYEFWYNAQSWREFGYHDEEVTNETDSREQKRYVEKKNKNARKKKQVADKSRMIKLIDNSYSADPRIKEFKLAAKQAKLDAVQKKKDEAIAKIAAAKKQEEEEAAAKLAAEKSAGADKKATGEALKRAKKAFVKACKKYELFTEAWKIDDSTPALALTFTEAEVQEYKGMFSADVLKGFLAQPDVESFITAIKNKVSGKDEEKQVASAETAVWSQDEQQLLEAALKDVPKDAADRWDQIAAKLAGRSVKACKLRVKELMKAAVVAKNKAPAEWTDLELQFLLKAASKVFPPGTQEIAGENRWMQIAGYLKTHSHTTWIREQKDIIAQVNNAKDVSKGLLKKKTNFDAHADFEKQKGKGRDKSSLPEPEN